MYTLEDLSEILNNYGYEICEYTTEVKNCKDELFFKDSDGFLYRGNLDKLRNRDSSFRKLHKSNPFSIHNANLIIESLNLDGVCIDTQYHSKEPMLFQCGCGEIFKTTFSNFIYGHKNKCDKCTGYHRQYSHDEVKTKLLNFGYILLNSEGTFKGANVDKLTCVDSDGYKVEAYFNGIINGEKAHIVHPTNPYSLENIQKFLLNHNLPFELIDDKYINNKTPIKFKCKRCGKTVETPWSYIIRYSTDGTFGRIYCAKCDGTIESLHATTLKQVFVHEYPDTTVEDKSFINPNTNCIMPTDIVNHKLKIAIEVQSQWHDCRAGKDKMKRDFWISKGYDFYAPDIRNYTILEMLQLFFDVDKIPDYVDFELANKLDIAKAQSLLDDKMTPTDVANFMNVKVHRIYDAIYSGNLKYSDDYVNDCYTRVVCFDMDMNKIDEFDSIQQASRNTGVSSGAISSALLKDRNYAKGYYWQKLEDYKMGKEIIPTRLKCYK